MPNPLMLPVSAATGAGLDEWIAWLEGRYAGMRRAGSGTGVRS